MCSVVAISVEYQLMLLFCVIKTSFYCSLLYSSLRLLVCIGCNISAYFYPATFLWCSFTSVSFQYYEYVCIVFKDHEISWEHFYTMIEIYKTSNYSVLSANLASIIRNIWIEIFMNWKWILCQNEYNFYPFWNIKTGYNINNQMMFKCQTISSYPSRNL